MANTVWIEVRHPVRLHGVRRVAGYRCQYPFNAAKSLAAQGKIIMVNGPHEGRQEAGYPTTDNAPEDSPEPETEQSEPAQESEEQKEDFPTAASKLESVNGIGEVTAKQIARQLDEDGLAVSDLLEMKDMTEIKGIGASTADDIRAELGNG